MQPPRRATRTPPDREHARRGTALGPHRSAAPRRPSQQDGTAQVGIAGKFFEHRLFKSVLLALPKYRTYDRVDCYFYFRHKLFSYVSLGVCIVHSGAVTFFLVVVEAEAGPPCQ